MSTRTLRRLAAIVLASLAWTGIGLVAGATGPAPEAATPELPSVADDVDGLYDAEGCLRTGPDERDCSVRAGQLDEALADGGPGDPRHLQGFVGTHWSDAVDGPGPVVLPATVSTATAGPFRATGLVRQQGPEIVAEVEVSARLLDADGAVLDEATAVSPVTDVRSGEPVPFTVTSPVAADQVARVEWVAAAGAAGVPEHRAASWTPYWERPAGGEPVDLHLYADGTGHRPHLVFGSVANVGADDLDGVEVVLGWLADGRLVQWAVAAAAGPDGEAIHRLAPGAAADVLVVADGPVPAGANPLVWVVGR